jgi:hypothetical protein
MKSYVCDVILDEETGDQILQFPEELIEKCDWRIGDTLSFKHTTEGIVLTNLDWQKRSKQAKLLKGNKNG